MAVPAFKAVWGAVVLSPVGSIPTPSAKFRTEGGSLTAHKEVSSRISIEQGHTRLRISIPLAPSESSRLHLTALLLIWLLGAAYVIASQFVQTPRFGSEMVQIGWLIAGLPVLWVYTRFAIGREVITITETKLQMSRRPLALGFRRKYLLSKARHFRVDTKGVRIGNRRVRRSLWRWRGEQGMILFDYDLTPIRFGVGLDVIEAKAVLAAIRASGFVDTEQIAT